MTVDKKNDGYQVFLTKDEYDAMLILIAGTHPACFLERYEFFAQIEAQILPNCNEDFDLYSIYKTMYDNR